MGVFALYNEYLNAGNVSVDKSEGEQVEFEIDRTLLMSRRFTLSWHWRQRDEK